MAGRDQDRDGLGPGADVEAALRRISRRRFLTVATALGATAAAGPLIAACAGATQTAAPTATEAPTATKAPTATAAPAIGGKIYHVGWEGQDGMEVPYLKKWREDNGVELVSTYVGSGDEMLAKIATDPGKVDFTMLHVEAALPAYEAGLLEPFDLSKLPNYQDFYPALKSSRWTYPDGKIYNIPNCWGPQAIVYDPEKWDGVPEAFYPGLADPKYKGELVCMDDPYSAIFCVSQSLGHPQPAYITQQELDDTAEALKGIMKNVVTVSGGALSDLVDIVMRGDASMIVFAGWPGLLPVAKERGKTLVFGSPPKSPGFWWVDNYQIPKAAANMETTYAYIDALMSPEGAAGISNLIGVGSVNMKAEGMLDPELQSGFPYDEMKKELPPEHPINVASDPPPTAKDGLVGIPEWKRAWQEVKLG